MRAHRFIGLAAVLLPAAAGAQLVKPGLWSTTTTITDVSMPGAPPQALAMMKRAQTITHCVTPEEAARDPRSVMQTAKGCTIEHFTMAGGRMDSAMVCKQQGGTMRMTSSGSFTPASYVATSRMVMSGGSGMKMTANVAGKLVGACK